MDPRTLRHLVLLKADIRVRHVDDLLGDALAADDGSQGYPCIALAREHVASLRLQAHLVAGVFGEDESLTRELRALHVEKSADIDAILARCETWWVTPADDSGFH